MDNDNTYRSVSELKSRVVSVDPTETKKAPTVITMTDGVLIPKKGNQHLFNSWRITFYGSVLLLVILCLVKKDVYWKIFLYTVTGIPTTFECTVFAILGAVIIGILTGLGSSSKNRLVNQLCGVYVELIRGIPLLVQLMFLYYALGSLIHIDGIVAAIVSLSICFGAYMGEIIRAGIQSIPKGQTEAATALGLSKSQTFIHVILPQTIKVVLPAIGNEFISMLKDSSLVSILALSDILKRGREYISRTFLSLQTMLVVALIYLILTLILSRLVGLMEEKLHKNG
jgi:polar amino acid transport system permease protein